MLALGAVIGAFVLFLLAIVLAVVDSGGDGGGAGVAQTTTTARKPPARKRPKRPAPGFPAVPASAPGAHKAPTESVPILAYAVINTPQPDTTNSQDWVPPEEFKAQMQYLSTQGFHPVTLRQVWAAWKEGGLLPSKPIVISFDAGYHSVYANALPELRARKWPGTLFLQVDQTQADFPPEEVKGLLGAGWELDSHGSTGADLTGLSDQELATEVTGSRQQLRQEFGGLVQFFSYPQGRVDDRVVQAVQGAGYLGGATFDQGLASPGDPDHMARIPVHNGDGESGMADKLRASGVK
jgi:peptidoglycan/xylan/chitin deacetylase (PgdA/CDA1 family)